MAELDTVELHQVFREIRTLLAAHRDRQEREREAKRAARVASLPMVAPVKSIPKRRRQVFEKSEGKCHYCATPLTLDGRWHIEHKMPRALLGGSEQENLVASCTTCNWKKKDKTDLEFIAQREGAAA